MTQVGTHSPNQYLVDKIFSVLTGLVLVAAVIGTKPLGGIVLVLLLFSLGWLAVNWRSLSPFSTLELCSAAFLVLFFFAHIGSRYLVAEQFNKGGYAEYMLAVIPMYIFAKERKISLKILAICACIAVLISLASSLWQVFVQGEDRANMLWGGHQIMFGDFSLVGLLVAITLFLSKPVNNANRIIVGMVFTAGVFAMLLSGTRGSYLAVPLSFLLIFVGSRIIYKEKTLLSFRYMLVLTIVIVISSVALLSSTKGEYYSNRLQSASTVADGVSNMEPTDSDFQKIDSADQSRLLMLRIAWLLFLEKPLLGHGWGSFQSSKNRLAEDSNIINQFYQLPQNKFLGFNQPHNDYLRYLAEQGIVGLIMLLLFLLVPFVVGMRDMMTSSRSNKSRIFALGSALIALAYMHFYLTEGITGRSGMFTHQLVLLSIFLSQHVRKSTQ